MINIIKVATNGGAVVVQYSLATSLIGARGFFRVGLGTSQTVMNRDDTNEWYSTVHDAHRHFQKQLHDGRAPSIEAFVAEFVRQNANGGDSRQELEQLLILAEVAHAGSIGESLELDSYVARFPDHQPFIERLGHFSASTHGPESTALLPARHSIRESELDFDVAVEPSPATLELNARYQVKRRLGRGGFGEVWLADDLVLNCPVAVKLPRSDRRVTDATLREFLHEARKVREIDCSGIVPVHDVFDHQGLCHVVMPYLEKGSLEDRIREGNVSTDYSIQVTCRVAEILGEVHDKGFVHRDIKPANILFDSKGAPLLSDLGLTENELTLDADKGAVVGTIQFIAPEVLMGKTATAQADIYSLGVVLYVLIAGELPFAGTGDAYRRQVVGSIAAKPLAKETLNGLPEGLEGVIHRCLERDLEKRYASMGELVADLKAALDAGTPIRHVKANKRTWWLVAGAVLLAAVASIPFLNRVDGSSTLDRPSDEAAIFPENAWMEDRDGSLDVGCPDDIVFFLIDKSDSRSTHIIAEFTQDPLEGRFGLVVGHDAPYYQVLTFFRESETEVRLVHAHGKDRQGGFLTRGIERFKIDPKETKLQLRLYVKDDQLRMLKVNEQKSTLILEQSKGHNFTGGIGIRLNRTRFQLDRLSVAGREVDLKTAIKN